MKELGLYIHIPFCKQKCLYCDFNSYVCSDAQIESYMEALMKELESYQQEHAYQYKTVFFGGGTPTFIHYRYLGAFMERLGRHLPPDAEITMECNPGTVNEESLRAYRSMGINRLSIGLQAWQEPLQRKLGRIHDTGQFLLNLEQARGVGFANISADLMFALPEQSLEMWLETVEQAARLGLQHLSCYSLKIEEGTPFDSLYRSKQLQLPEEELDREMYHGAIKLLKNHGLQQYEISNFALPGYECRHNLIYWNNEEYLGIGAGSHSKIDNIRFNNYPGLEAYIGALRRGSKPIEEQIPIGEREDMWETVILALRQNKGLDMDAFNAKYKVDFEGIYREALQKLWQHKLLERDGRRLKLTSLGMDLSNLVFIEFLEP
jgi:oxygen-independent coproporphyrinogen-3 oxidase